MELVSSSVYYSLFLSPGVLIFKVRELSGQKQVRKCSTACLWFICKNKWTLRILIVARTVALS